MRICSGDLSFQNKWSIVVVHHTILVDLGLQQKNGNKTVLIQNDSHSKLNARIRFKEPADNRGRQSLLQYKSQSSKSQTFKLRPIIFDPKKKKTETITITSNRKKRKVFFKAVDQPQLLLLLTQMQNTEGNKGKNQTAHSWGFTRIRLKILFFFPGITTYVASYTTNLILSFFFPGTTIHNYTTCKRTLVKTISSAQQASVHRQGKQTQLPLALPGIKIWSSST